MKVDSWSISDIGRTRESNEDAVGRFDDLNLFIVADGMGGHADGEVASRMAVEIIHGFFNDRARREPGPSDVDCLKRAVELANRRIHEEGQRSVQESRGRTLGTTVVVLKLAPWARRASWVHVGDSRLYRLRNRALALLTADHTLYGQEYLDHDAIPTDLPHTNKLVQALGVHEQVVVTTGSDGLMGGDRFMLCSDGVSGQLAAAAIAQQLAATDDLQAVARSLIRLSLEAGGRDNASAVLVRAFEE